MSSMLPRSPAADSALSLTLGRRYWPVVAAVVVLAINSVGMAALLGVTTFFQDHSLSVSLRVVIVTVAVFLALLVLCHLMLLKGRAAWVWGIALQLLACLCFTLPAIEHRPVRPVYAVGVFSPLIGLCLLNSSRHRQWRRRMVELRQQGVTLTKGK
ncbi:hypothetical protein ACIPL1_05840 [Pseudomonas sp. NPDC090202]|uniref:hypothetical protein n=1 Tax=unclassified Pseudomonas TaxID=196821 RepID=UPI00382C5E0B